MQSTLDGECPHKNILAPSGKPFSETKCIDCGLSGVKPGFLSKVYSDMKRFNIEAKKRLRNK